MDMDKYVIKTKLTIERFKEIILAVLAALLISCFIISHTQVPTESMKPTIIPGNHLIVNRLPYYYRNPVRGEIVVFEQGGKHLIKRVIGEPGDCINLVEGAIYVNDERLEESDYLYEENCTFAFSHASIKFPYVVPENHYFVLGDCRRNSSDSRLFGAIERKNIIAKAGYRIYPLQSIGFIK